MVVYLFPLGVRVNCERIHYPPLHFQGFSLCFLFYRVSMQTYNCWVFPQFSLYRVKPSCFLFSLTSLHHVWRQQLFHIEFPYKIVSSLVCSHSLSVNLNYPSVLDGSRALMPRLSTSTWIILMTWQSVHIWHAIGEYGVVLDNPSWSFSESMNQSKPLGIRGHQSTSWLLANFL